MNRELLLNDRQDLLADVTACLFLMRAIGCIESTELSDRYNQDYQVAQISP